MNGRKEVGMLEEDIPGSIPVTIKHREYDEDEIVQGKRYYVAEYGICCSVLLYGRECWDADTLLK